MATALPPDETTAPGAGDFSQAGGQVHLWLRNRVLKQSTRQGQEAGSPGRDEDEPLEDIEPLSLPVHCCLPSQLEVAKKETAGRRVAGRAC